MNKESRRRFLRQCISGMAAVLYVILSPEALVTAKTTEQVNGEGLFGAYVASKDYIPPRDQAVLKKLHQWQDWKFGLLITWGTYSQWGIVESWTLCPERYEWNRRSGPFADDDQAYKKSYENLMTTFDPTNFRPESWAAAAKEAGVKYVLVMSKHHDGFCMFDSAQTDYKVTSKRCPFSKSPHANVTNEISSAFRRQGIRTGVYFSKADWHSPYYWSPNFPLHDRNPNYNPKTHPELWNKFKDFTWNQIEELMTDYGPMDILWLDGGQVQPASNQDIDMNGIAAMARKHQPGLIVVDRTVKGENENYVTPENTIPSKMLPYPWESCMPLGNQWSFKAHDDFKSAGTIIRNLCRIVARGGNYLVGIGPGPDGELDPEVYKRLDEIGAWLKINGEAIYGSRPIAPYERGGYVFTTKSDGTVYVILLAKDDKDTIPESMFIPTEMIANRPAITLLGYGQLQAGQSKGGQTAIPIPAAFRNNPPCRHAWTLKCAPRTDLTTSQPLIIDGKNDMTIKGLSICNCKGNGITLRRSKNIRIEGCQISNCIGEGINILGCDGVTVTNNRFEHVRSAVYAQDSSRIVVTYNRCLNVQGPMPRGQFTQFNRVNGPGSRINFNFVENILGQNHAEDAINIFNSNGREKDPIQIIGNRIRGSSISPSGGGIMTGDGSGSYILVQNNTLVNPGQYGIAIAGGNHIQILSNRVFGQKQSFTNVGIYAWNQSTIPSYGHTVRGNQVKWFNKNGKLNSSWDGGNVGSIAGWKNNNWNADLDSSIITPRSMREARQLMAPMKLLGEYNEQ